MSLDKIEARDAAALAVEPSTAVHAADGEAGDGGGWAALIEDLREVGLSQQHIDSDFARSTNAAGTVRRAVSLLQALQITHDDACRLSRAFGKSADLRSGDHRINEWLKCLIVASQ